MDQEHAGDDDAPRLKFDKRELTEPIVEADKELHKNWRFEKDIPIGALVGIVGLVITGVTWYQSVNDQIAAIRAAEIHDATQIDNQTSVFARIASDSNNTNLRLTAVEVKLSDVIDGIKRIEERQGGDPPGK
ncbi:MAG: hypothetical protein WDN02_06920 [Methylovirgula sp.]|uniref:hypothetical protein n=1 Tax=Methylovirgula sp. TaxID=1978224 RepID=UPI0030764BAD